MRIGTVRLLARFDNDPVAIAVAMIQGRLTADECRFARDVVSSLELEAGAHRLNSSRIGVDPLLLR